MELIGIVIFVLLGMFVIGASERAGKKECPHCAELVRNKATICSHCGRDLPVT